MLEIKDEFKSTIKELDEMLYYDPEELKKMIIEEERLVAIEEGRQKGIIENQKQIIKNMIDNELSDEIILKSLNITEDELLKIKETIK